MTYEDFENILVRLSFGGKLRLHYPSYLKGAGPDDVDLLIFERLTDSRYAVYNLTDDLAYTKDLSEIRALHEGYDCFDLNNVLRYSIS